jgi:hypothetical protein
MVIYSGCSFPSQASVWRTGFCFVRADERTGGSIRRDQSPQAAEAKVRGPLRGRFFAPYHLSRGERHREQQVIDPDPSHASVDGAACAR